MAIVIDGSKGIFGVPAVYEKSVSSATAATGTVDFDVLNQSLLQYTTNASGNWTINFRGNSSTTLNSLLPVGQSITAVFLAKQGTTPYYNAEIKIDGAVIVPNWQGGSAPTAGTASGFDAYTYLIIKTGNANFSVYASLTNYASYVPPLADAYFNLTTLLLHGDGTNGAQNNTFLDSSTNNFTITRNGNATQGTFTPFSQTGWSVNFPNSNYQNLQVASSADFNFGTGNGDFTIECFFNPSYIPQSGDASFTRLFATAYLDIFFYNGSLYFRNNGGSELATPASHGMTAGNWYHLAFVRSGSNYYVYRNGTQIMSGSGTSVTSSSSAFYIGTTSSFNNPCSGFISDFRVTNGQALYSSTFTPATSQLTTTSQGATAANVKLLTCQSNRFIDNSTASPKTILFGDNGSNLGTRSVQAFSPFAPTAAYSAATVGGSAYFDGSGDYLSVANNGLALTGTQFTAEMWVYPTQLTGMALIENAMWVSGHNGGYRLEMNSSGAIVLTASGGFNSYPTVITSSNKVNINSWNHISINRNASNQVTVYINGVSTTTPVTYTGSLNIYNDYSGVTVSSRIGIMLSDGTLYNAFRGYLTDVRVDNGTALRTGNFSVPTAPVSALGSTTFLGKFANAGIIDQTGKNDLETVGNAQISTAVKKYGTGSLAFDGSSDSLFIPYSPSIDLKASYTIEAWIYPTTTSGWRPIFNIQAVNSGAFGSLSFAQNGSALVMEIRPTTGGSLTSVSGGTLTANTWQHVTVAVAAGSARLFVNGTQVGSTTAVPDYSFTPIGAAVGANANGYNLSTESFNGYIDDLRITKGFARYTTTFTPPAAAFADQ